MEFLQNIKKSIYSPTYYQELLAKPFSYSIKYYALLALCLAFLGSVIFSIFIAPEIKSAINTLGEKMVAYYPSDLKVEIKNGKVSTNKPEPYVLPMPAELINSNVKINDARARNFKNLLVIDTVNNFNTVEQFKMHDAAYLLTKDSIISYNTRGLSIMPLSSDMNFSIDRQKTESFINVIKPYTVLVYPLTFLIVFIVIWFIFLFKFIYLLFGALLVWLVAKFKKIKMGYQKSYQLGIHLMTLGILIDIIVFGVNSYLKVHFFTFFFTILLVVMASLNLKRPVTEMQDEKSNI